MVSIFVSVDKTDASHSASLHTCCLSQVVAEGKENIDFSNIISMNETSAFIWEALGDKEFDADMMASLLLEKYDVDAEVAKADCENLLRGWSEIGIVE